MRRIILVSFLISIGISLLGQIKPVESYLPPGYVKNGTRDYTEYLQKAIDENEKVILPNFSILINERGLSLKSNQTIEFQNSTALIMKPNSREKYGVLNLINVDNVIINNPKLIGDRKGHLGSKGEWGMGINIRSSSNISINNPSISEMWGDGIYIGEVEYKDRRRYKLSDYTSRNIKINGGVIDFNRRNGISIVSVKNLLVKNIIIKNTEGTMPMAGIDIEPNNNGQSIEHVVLDNVTTKNNKEVGIKYVPNNFFGSRKKSVTIKILNSQDIGSNVGLFIGGVSRANEKRLSNIRQFDGDIFISGYKAIGNTVAIKAGSIQKYNPKILFELLNIYDSNNQIKDSKDIKSMLKSNKIFVD